MFDIESRELLVSATRFHVPLLRCRLPSRSKWPPQAQISPQAAIAPPLGQWTIEANRGEVRRCPEC